MRYLNFAIRSHDLIPIWLFFLFGLPFRLMFNLLFRLLFPLIFGLLFRLMLRPPVEFDLRPCFVSRLMIWFVSYVVSLFVSFTLFQVEHPQHDTYSAKQEPYVINIQTARCFKAISIHHLTSARFPPHGHIFQWVYAIFWLCTHVR